MSARLRGKTGALTLAMSSAVLRLSSDPNLDERLAGALSRVPIFGQQAHGRRMQTVNATQGELLRGRLIVIGFVAAAPIAVGAWLWLLGWVALTLL